MQGPFVFYRPRRDRIMQPDGYTFEGQLLGAFLVYLLIAVRDRRNVDSHHRVLETSLLEQVWW